MKSLTLFTNRLHLARLLFAAAVVTALVMACLPQPPRMGLNLSDKGQHAIAFVVLTALARAAFPGLGKAWIFAGLAAFGGLIEVIQAIPALGRDPSLMDWLADWLAIGVTLGLIGLVWEFCGRRRHTAVA